jgi:tRNA pseudouridine38-40 synthase
MLDPSGMIETSGTQGPGGLVRARLDLGYDGGGFAGWAAQPGQRTVAGVLVEGLATLLRLPAEDLVVVVAGRTDTGVHARGQVCHVDVPLEGWQRLPGRSDLPPERSLLRRLAGVLPPDIRVHRAAVAAPGFDARFSALRRRYSYRICDTGYSAPPLRRHDVLVEAGPLDDRAMDAASRSLVGLNDFAAFCRRRDGATTVRHLLEYSWSREQTSDGELLVARVVADAFCHSMVRALVGGAVAVGSGRRPAGWLREAMLTARRDPAVGVVAPRGLVLEEVVYPPDDELAGRAAEARNTRTLPPGQMPTGAVSADRTPADPLPPAPDHG